jgi:hypothetical protein
MGLLAAFRRWNSREARLARKQLSKQAWQRALRSDRLTRPNRRWAYYGGRDPDRRLTPGQEIPPWEYGGTGQDDSDPEAGGTDY